MDFLNFYLQFESNEPHTLARQQKKPMPTGDTMAKAYALHMQNKVEELEKIYQSTKDENAGLFLGLSRHKSGNFDAAIKVFKTLSGSFEANIAIIFALIGKKNLSEVKKHVLTLMSCSCHILWFSKSFIPSLRSAMSYFQNLEIYMIL